MIIIIKKNSGEIMIMMVKKIVMIMRKEKIKNEKEMIVKIVK